MEEIPVTSPVPDTVAIPGAEVLQAPSGVGSANVIVLPIHTGVPPPVMGAGALVTVTIADVIQPPVDV